MTQPAGAVSTGRGPLGLNFEVVAIIAGVVVMTHAASMVTVPLLPRFVTELGGSVLVVGLALSSYAAARLITNIPAGMLSERIGRRPVIIAGAIGVGIFGSLSGTAATIPVFMAYRFMMGLFSAMAITTSNAAIADITTVENRGRTLSLVSGAHLVMGIAAPGLGGIVGELVGIRVPFYASGVPAILVGIWALARLPETRTSSRAVVQGHAAPQGHAAGPGEARSGGGPGRSWADTRMLLANRSFLLVCVIGFAQFFTRAGVSHALIPIFADQVIGIGPGRLGMFFSIAAVIHGLMVYPAGMISDRFGRKVLIVPGGLLVVAALVFYPFAGTLAAFAFAFIALHGAEGFSGGAPNAYVGDTSPPGLRGLGFGIYRTFGDLAGMISPLLLTGLATTSFLAGFFFAAALHLGATLAFALGAVETAGKRRGRRASASP
ncbi:MAG: MFS transporter [Chloroflexi bacterium]|nr:MFS transporter [Chloroflexota bacterium]MCH7655904.1 MFS transporter [Chloroflexota bacterium]